MEYLATFGVGLVTVFVAGFQSRSVNHGNYRWAAFNSFLLSVGNATMWTHIVKSSDPINYVVYGFAGSIAITASMYVHDRFVKK
jgi:hypothetical protein